MPIVHKEIAESHTLAVWESNEPEAEFSSALALSASEQEELRAITSFSRRREFLTVRRLLIELSGTDRRLLYSPEGRPILSDGTWVSISHSKNRVAMILSENHPVGIDIEQLRPQIRALSEKFVSDQERRIWGIQPDDTTLHLIWGAKEVLYKLYSKGGIDFRADLFVDKNADGPVTARLRRPDEDFIVNINHGIMDGFMLVWARREN
jgi:4'-phosphopantetheinyl transferase